MEPRRIRDSTQVEYGELPELTRALRAFGSARRGGGSLQSIFFLPLIEARRRAAESRNAHASVRAFDATELRRALDRAIDRLVFEWPDERASARRAMRAELMERASGYADALDILAARASAVLVADQENQPQAWRAWTAQLAATFAAA